MMISKSNDAAAAGAVVFERPAPPLPPAAAASPAPPGAPAPAPEQVERAMQMISKAIQPIARHLRFSVDDSTGKSVVRVEDTETGKLIRQIPSQEALDIARVLDRMQGLLLNGTA